jgi:hypothetical protein
MSNKTKKDTKIETKKDTKKKIKMHGGINVISASFGVVIQSIDLGGSMFKAIGGIMSMPKDMANAIPPQQRRTEPAQVNTPPPKKMPKFK